MPGLLKQTRSVDPWGGCISLFFWSNTSCFLQIPLSLIFCVQILDTLTKT